MKFFNNNTLEEVEALQKENKRLTSLTKGLMGVIRQQIEMFESADPVSGVHILTVGHEELIKLKNKLEEIIL